MRRRTTQALLVSIAAALLAVGPAAVLAEAAAKPRPRGTVHVHIKHAKLFVTGTAKRDVYTLRLKRQNRRVLQIDVGNNGSADREVSRGRVKSIAISTGRGNDVVRIDERNGAFERSGKVTVTLGDGNDSFTGGSAAEKISAGKGRDSVNGNGGNDKVALGAGDDSFRWGAGGGADTVDGQGGNDKLTVNGSRATDALSLSARGARLAALRAGDRAPVNAGGFESLALNVAGGADAITFDNLAGTGLARVAVDLGAGDSQPDQVVVNGTAGDDRVSIGSAGVTGLAAPIALGSAGSGDRLTLNLLGGTDAADAQSLPAGPLALTMNGGEGDDVLVGGNGDDTIDGGPGNDSVDGNPGNDSIALGDGDDKFTWNSGDGADVVEGGGGSDQVTTMGSDTPDVLTLTAHGARTWITRDPDVVAVDADDVENVVLASAGGADSLTVGDLSGTDVTRTTFDFGGADLQPDLGTVMATDGNDTVTVTGNGVSGAGPPVAVAGAEAGLDRVAVNLLNGDDKADTSAVPAGTFAVTMNGGAGNDTFVGGPGDDTADGGTGTDTATLGDGNDSYVWSPGDGADTFEGQGGSDTVVFEGGDGADSASLAANGARLALTNTADGGVDSGGVENVAVNGHGGADLLTVGDLTGTPVTQTTADLGAGDGQPDAVVANGTAGNDSVKITDAGVISGLPTTIRIADADAADRLTVNALGGTDTLDASAVPAGTFTVGLNGGDLADTLIGGQGNDQLAGGRGDDLALMGAGDDAFSWFPGDGSDTIEGQAGTDTLIFNGANVSENIDISANGSRVRFFRDVANITMDLNDVEGIDFNALGGADNVTVNDLTGTAVTYLNVDLASSTGTGDGAADQVIVAGTAAGDNLAIDSAGVHGLPWKVGISGSEAIDRLTVNAGGGADTLDASAVPAGAIGLSLNGGALSDTITGSPGSDQASGGPGNDVALLGDGDDTFTWNPGDGSDIVEGQAGTDSLIFNGANISENMAISANGSRALLTRDVANIVMDLNGIEHAAINALGGADTITVNDLTGNVLSEVDMNLAAGGGGGDGAADHIVVNGRDGPADAASLSGGNGSVEIDGLAPTIFIAAAEPANDTLTVNLFGGNDVINAQALAATSIHLIENGGDGNDSMIGSKAGDEMNGENGDDSMAGDDGDDFMTGGAGDDFLAGGNGNDTLDGGTGTNTVIQ